MICAKLSIFGKVKAKERPRRGKWGNFYTPHATHDYEALVHYNAIQAGLTPITSDNIGIEILFYGMYGKSDIDNLIKTVLDGLKHFFNDNKVMEIHAKKIPAKEYRTEIIIK